MVEDATREVKEREKETLLRLARAGEFRDEETGYHLLRMSRYSRLIANALGLHHDEAETIELAAPLHDIGKIGIPDHILLKAGKLEDGEWQVMRRHPVIGHEILKGSASKYVRMGALIALGHHERYDGSGYPNGLVGDHVPLCARIVAVADVYDALTSKRPYKSAWTSDEAFDYVRSQAGRHFDPRMVEAFLGVRRQVLEIQDECRDPLATAGRS
jgi:two-component system response regulator RpfG